MLLFYVRLIFRSDYLSSVKDEPMSHMSSPVIDLTDTPANHHGGRKPLDDFANMSIQETDSPLVRKVTL